MSSSVAEGMELTEPEVVVKSCLSIQPFNNRVFNPLPSIAGMEHIYISFYIINVCYFTVQCLLFVNIGIKPLTAAEIKKDLKEVEKLLRVNFLTDDECLSDDVLQSSFPVKPRKTSRLWPRKLSCMVEDVADTEQNEEYLHQIMEFFKMIEKSNNIR